MPPKIPFFLGFAASPPPPPPPPPNIFPIPPKIPLFWGFAVVGGGFLVVVVQIFMWVVGSVGSALGHVLA